MKTFNAVKYLKFLQILGTLATPPPPLHNAFYRVLSSCLYAVMLLYTAGYKEHTRMDKRKDCEKMTYDTIKFYKNKSAHHKQLGDNGCVSD